MNNFKEMFSILKENGVNEYFNMMNRSFVLTVSADGANPKPASEIESEFDEIGKRAQTLSNKSDVSLISDDVGLFLKKKIFGDMSYRHHTIDMSEMFHTILEYFIVTGDVPEDQEWCAQTFMNTSFRHEELEDGCDEVPDPAMVVHATMVVYENHPSVTEDTLGKIIKHELTHILLEVMEFVMKIPYPYKYDEEGKEQENFDNIDEFRGFQEFLCDYIPVDSSAERGEDPIAKFEDIQERFLTWIASDLYEPYLKAVVEYYKEKEEHDKETDTENTGDTQEE